MSAVDTYLKAARYEFSSTQLNLPTELAQQVRRIASHIDPRDLVKKEFVPHISLKYGLHTTDPAPVEQLLADEPPIRVRFGKTDFFPAENSPDSQNDVLYVKVFSPDMRRIHKKLIGSLPHTMNYPKYEPHVTVAYLKKGRAQKYAGRTDLNNVEHTFDTVRFSKPSGRKFSISLQKTAFHQPGLTDYLNTAPAWMAGGAAAGAIGGRYIAAPILSKLLGLDPQRARTTLTLLGLLGGSIPGLMLGSNRSKLRGSFFAPGGGPRNIRDLYREAYWTMGKNPMGMYDVPAPPPRSALPSFESTPASMDAFMGLNKSSNYRDPGVYSRALWEPTFPVAQSMDEISNNPHIPVMQRAKMVELVAQAGNEQGVGLTGMASAGSLMSALPRVAAHAVPTVGGAWLASKALGAPRRLKNTAMGAALVYSALKGFMEKGSSSEPRLNRYLDAV